MLPARVLLFLVLSLWVAPFGRAANSFLGGGRSHVAASLVAADTSVQPGHELTVALRLVHDPHWHTYWVNPGTGLATTINWKLPPGWKAGPILWPVPKVLTDHTGTIIGQGYEGEVLLPVVLTPPTDLAPGSTVTLNANVDWLMCQDVCVPGSAEVTLTLPVTGKAADPDPAWGEKIRAAVAALPRADQAWQVSASRAGNTVTVSVVPTSQTSHQPTDLRFFSTDGLIAYDQPQAATPTANGGVVLTLPIAADGPQNATRLTGVLSSANGWLDNGSLPGLAIDVPFGAAISPPPAAGNAASAASTPPPAGSLAATLLLAFIGGLILNLMPCVFPVLGIKILGFVNQAGHDRRRVIAHGLTFAAGVLVSFWILAGVLETLRAGGDQLGWGFQLQSPAFVYGLTVLMLVFGMNMSGVFEFGLRATAVGSGLQSKSGYAGSFFSGVLATVVATPCSAPFLAPALGAALAVSAGASFAIFTAIAIGLSTPYLLLSIFPQAVKVLPRPGAWMETFKQIMAFPLYATAAYLIWVLAAQTGDEGFRNVLFSLVVVALAVWMYGRWTAPGASAGRVSFGVASLVLVGALGLWVGWPRPLPAPGSAAAATAIDWQPWSPDQVTKLRNEGRIVYVDFTARWCATCQANKRLVFHDDQVLKYFADHHIATLRADWTNQDPRITAALASYGRSAVPFNLIWVPGRDQPIVLPEILTASTVLDALKTAGKS
ncbi:MAG TPA: protein-disulfide reductase DsbD domain-containing protein [Opitutaceae bacterium]|nr:protein-disulfide reductase DsbD domain-containing protein [Opitutaceae bacterium]